MASVTTRTINVDFWKFWVGQVISTFGTSFTMFAIPLLIYKLTGSAVNLALATAATFLPYLLFGLIIGAWVDRLDRKRLMIGVDILLAITIGSIPLMSHLGLLSVWWIYAAEFVGSTFNIFFTSAEFAAIPSLVDQDDLVTANGRIQASYSAATVAGPLVAGILVAFISLPTLLLVDAGSYLVSALALTLVRRSFNLREERQRNSIRADVVEGLRYVLGHPVLRNISIMMALVNFVGATTASQLVLFAKVRLGANNSEIGLLFSAGAAGVVILGLTAGLLRKRWSFSVVALGALMADGLLGIGFALNHRYWLAVPLMALVQGVGVLFNINTSSLRQAIVPNHMLGRVMSIAGVLAWSAIPLGAIVGGIAIQSTHNVAAVFAVIGVLTFLIPLGFAFTALGHAERYLPKDKEVDELEAAGA
ncbi:MAG: MFS transporter [Chloroflexota bacterium]|nr:MFS transporter [Chloroflexota bacterium]